jgi:hypothetical protein
MMITSLASRSLKFSGRAKGKLRRTLEMALFNVGFGAVFLAPKRRFMIAIYALFSGTVSTTVVRSQDKL